MEEGVTIPHTFLSFDFKNYRKYAPGSMYDVAWCVYVRCVRGGHVSI